MATLPHGQLCFLICRAQSVILESLAERGKTEAESDGGEFTAPFAEKTPTEGLQRRVLLAAKRDG
jgi:hypothetical protein